MNFARFGRTYHSFQSVYQGIRKEGFPSFFRVLGRCIREETTDHRAGKTQQHMLESLQIKKEPHLGIQKPIKGNNMPLWRMNKIRSLRLTEGYIVCLLCFMFHFIFSAASSLRSAVCICPTPVKIAHTYGGQNWSKHFDVYVQADTTI